PPPRPARGTPAEFCGLPRRQGGAARTRAVKPAAATTRTAAGAARPRRATGARTPKQRAGAAAEDAACAHLAAHGCRIVARNVRYRVGELDIVAFDDDELVFVEVRLRTGNAFGGAAASVDAFKQRRLVRAAQQFLAAH